MTDTRARDECEERNRRLQETIALYKRDNTVTMDADYYEEEKAEARAALLAELRREFELRLLLTNGDGQRAFDEAVAALRETP